MVIKISSRRNHSQTGQDANIQIFLLFRRTQNMVGIIELYKHILISMFKGILLTVGGGRAEVFHAFYYHRVIKVGNIDNVMFLCISSHEWFQVLRYNYIDVLYLVYY